MERCLHKLYSRRAAVLLFSCPTTSELKQPALETLTITSKLRIKLGVSECLWIYHSGRNVIHQPTKYFSDKFRRGSRILTFSENIFKKALVLAMFDYVWVSKNVKHDTVFERDILNNRALETKPKLHFMKSSLVHIPNPRISGLLQSFAVKPSYKHAALITNGWNPNRFIVAGNCSISGKLVKS